jgi:hypothetical protein
MTQISTPGVYDLPAEVYHADPAPQPSLSSGIARLILNRSPIHAWTASPRLNPDWEPTENKTFDIGRAAHRAVLGKGGDYVAYPSELLASNGAASTKESKTWAEEQRQLGRTVLRADDVDRIGAMSDAVSAALAAMKIRLDPARSELTAIAEIDGIWCRAMIDNAPTDNRLPLYDLKSCEDASPESVIRSVMNYGYDVQAAHYLDVWKAATGEARRFRFIFVEKSAPFGVSVVELHNDPSSDADWMLDAQSKTREARRIWAECLARNEWPGYPAQVAVIGAPSYYRTKWADRSVGATVQQSTIDRAAAWQAPEGFSQ